MFIINMSGHMLIINIKRPTKFIMGLNNSVTRFKKRCSKILDYKKIRYFRII